MNHITLFGVVARRPAYQGRASRIPHLTFWLEVAAPTTGKQYASADVVRCRLWGERATALKCLIKQGSEAVVHGRLRIDRDERALVVVEDLWYFPTAKEEA